MNNSIYPIVMMSTMTLAACNSHSTALSSDNGITGGSVPSGKSTIFNSVMNSEPVSAMPHVIVYRMSGDYANLVPITLSDDGKIVSYPDPVDIRHTKLPEPLGDGWYLDHRGVNTNTAFTSYTYDEYSKLPKVPTQQELMSHIIARKAITDIKDLGQGYMSLEEVKKKLK